jgi:hypothetical protein
MLEVRAPCTAVRIYLTHQTGPLAQEAGLFQTRPEKRRCSLRMLLFSTFVLCDPINYCHVVYNILSSRLPLTTKV